MYCKKQSCPCAFFNWSPRHESVMGEWRYSPRILDFDTRLRWVVSFMTRPLHPQGRTPRTHWLGGWVGPRAGLDAVMKREIPSPYRDSNLRSSSPYPSAIPLSYPCSKNVLCIWFFRNLSFCGGKRVGRWRQVVGSGRRWMKLVNRSSRQLLYYNVAEALRRTIFACFIQTQS
jgi:hypothetical protein